MSTQTQPAPVLAWHREAAAACHKAVTYFGDNENAVVAIIAAHDPHATTVRLLEESFTVVSNLGSTLAMISSPDTRWESPMMQQYREYRDRVRAHLASLRQEGAAK